MERQLSMQNLQHYRRNRHSYYFHPQVTFRDNFYCSTLHKWYGKFSKSTIAHWQCTCRAFENVPLHSGNRTFSSLVQSVCKCFSSSLLDDGRHECTQTLLACINSLTTTMTILSFFIISNQRRFSTIIFFLFCFSTHLIRDSDESSFFSLFASSDQLSLLQRRIKFSTLASAEDENFGASAH